MGNDRDSQVQRLYDRLKSMASQLLSHEQSAQTLQTTLVVHDAFDRISKRQMSDGEFLAQASKAMRWVVIDHIRKKYAQKWGGPGLSRAAAGEGIACPPIEPESRCDEYDPSDSSMESFLAYDRSESTRERIRKENRKSYSEFVARHRRDDEPSEFTMTDEQIGILHDAMKELYQDDQVAAQVIDMAHFGHLSYEQIAKAIGSAKSTVSDTYHRGLKKLREYLTENP